jgi:PAS domain S-box-containing protein
MGEPAKIHLGLITRLTLLVIGIVVAVVLALGSLATLGQRRQFHEAQAAKATILVHFVAQIASHNLLSLNFVDLNKNAKEVVLTDDEAVYAVILNGQGIPLVYFFKNTAHSVSGEARDHIKNRKPLDAIESMKHAGGIMAVTAPITAGERRIGSVMMGFSTDKMRKALLTQILLIGAILAATICLSIAPLIVVLRRILQPVPAITAAANRISAGDLNVVFEGTTRADELGGLSRAFECMTGRMRELIAGLGSQLRFTETLLGTIPLAVFYKDTEGRYLGCNEEFTKIMGVTKDDIAGKTVFELWPSDLAETYHQQDLVLMSNPGIQTYEFKVCNYKGELLDVLYNKNAFLDDKGHVAGIVGTFLDITVQKRAVATLAEREREFHSLAENIPNNIARYDRNGRTLYINPSLEKTIGIKLEEAIGKTPREYGQNCTFDKCLETLEKVIATGVGDKVEITFPDEKGEVIHHLINFVPERDQKGEMTGILAIGSDITDLRRSSQELIMEQKRRSEMALALSMAEERERHAIATELHNRIGQDLALAKIRLGVLAKGALNDKAVTLLNGIREILDGAIRYVRTLTRRITPPILESGSLELALKWLCRQMNDDYGLHVLFQDDGSSKNVTRELRVELYNAVRELLINVAKHAGANSACILAACENGCLTIIVVDDGIGCDPVYMDTCLNGEGSGFGLFNVRRRIVHLGGALGIESSPGNGCRISIMMPLTDMRS